MSTSLESPLARTAPSTLALELLSHAKPLLRDLKQAEATRPSEPGALNILAGWTAEMTLKAFLASRSFDKARLESLGHDLARLWDEAATQGLDVPVSPPAWCLVLATTHGRRLAGFGARQESRSVPTLPLDTVSELTRLVSVAEAAIRG